MTAEKKFIVTVLSIIAASISAPAAAAPLRDIPDSWIQPDGTVVNLMVSGDESHRHVIDDKGFTVLRNFETGWLHYADVVDGRLVETPLAAGIDNPALAGITAGLRMPPEQVASLHDRRLVPRISGDTTPSTGTVTNLFVFIRFSDDDILLEETAQYERQFNGIGDGEASLRAYFREVSRDAVDVVTEFTPPPDGKWMTAYTAPQVRRYYRPWDAVYNTDGYRNDTELEQREHALLKDALAYVEADIPDDVDFDMNDDGFFDNVIFMVQGWPDTWSDLLWPHKWEFYDNVECNGLKVGTYNLQLSVLMLISPGTFVHEMYHSFGAPDLYHYSLDDISPVGPWDVMDETGLYAAQHPLAYMKWKYGNWVDDLPLVTENSEIILSSSWDEGTQAVRVEVPESTSQYFVMEYRHAVGMFESSLPGSGLLVYRIDPSREGSGNRNGPPDEIWIFRPGGAPYANGDIANAAMRAGRRTVMNEWTDPFPALGNQTPVTLRVYDVGTADNNIAFKLCLNPPGCGDRVCGDDGCGGWCGDCDEGEWCPAGACVPCSCDGKECGDDGCGNSCGECADEDACTADQCVDGACVFLPDDGAECDDGDDCTSGDACDENGACTGVAYECTPPQCNSSTCDGQGGCVTEPLAAGLSCDDGDALTENDQCDDNGECHGTTVVTPDVIADTDERVDVRDVVGNGDTAVMDTTEPVEIVEAQENNDGGCGQGRGVPAFPALAMLLAAIAAFALSRKSRA